MHLEIGVRMGTRNHQSILFPFPHSSATSSPQVFRGHKAQPEAKSTSLPIVNKVLLEHSHDHVFTHCLRHLLLYVDRV
jgi:hypothetical protein